MSKGGTGAATGAGRGAGKAAEVLEVGAALSPGDSEKGMQIMPCAPACPASPQRGAFMPSPPPERHDPGYRNTFPQAHRKASAHPFLWGHSESRASPEGTPSSPENSSLSAFLREP